MPSLLYARLLAEVGPRCGYCQTSAELIGQPLTIEHIIPVARGGDSSLENLWLSCRRCNQYKGAKIEDVDPETGQIVPLFNPRTESWAEHFQWSGDGTLVIGLTAVGRATVQALRLNNPEIVPARRIWVSIGWHPPAN